MASAEESLTKAHCNSCRQTTNHRILQSRTHSELNQDWETHFDMLECCGCEDIMLRQRWTVTGETDTAESFFPPRASRWLPKWHLALPREFKGLLREIYTALQADSRRLAMMGARTVIETAMVKRVGDHGTFASNLQALESSGDVSKKNRLYLEAALEAGNAAAHRAHRATQEQVDTVMDIVENLLHSLFVLEKPSSELKDAIPTRPRPVRRPPNTTK